MQLHRGQKLKFKHAGLIPMQGWGYLCLLIGGMCYYFTSAGGNASTELGTIHWVLVVYNVVIEVQKFHPNRTSIQVNRQTRSFLKFHPNRTSIQVKRQTRSFHREVGSCHGRLSKGSSRLGPPPLYTFSPLLLIFSAPRK